MFDAAAKALSQMFSAPMRAILWEGDRLVAEC